MPRRSVLRRGPWMGGQSAYRRLYSPFYVRSSITAAYRIEKVSVQGLNLEPCAKEANALTVRVNALTAESSVKFRYNSLERINWQQMVEMENDKIDKSVAKLRTFFGSESILVSIPLSVSFSHKFLVNLKQSIQFRARSSIEFCSDFSER